MVLLDLPYSRDYFLSTFIQAGLNPNIKARSSLLEVVRTLVANNVGYSLANVRPRANVSTVNGSRHDVPFRSSARTYFRA